MQGMNYIGALTTGVQDLVKDNELLLRKLLSQFAEEVHRRKDWFYEILVEDQDQTYRFFVADNGEDGYTAMLPEEY